MVAFTDDNILNSPWHPYSDIGGDTRGPFYLYPVLNGERYDKDRQKKRSGDDDSLVRLFSGALFLV